MKWIKNVILTTNLESGLKRTNRAWSSSTFALRHLCSRSKKSLVLQIRTVRSSAQEARYFPLLLKSRHVTFPLWLWGAEYKHESQQDGMWTADQLKLRFKYEIAGGEWNSQVWRKPHKPYGDMYFTLKDDIINLHRRNAALFGPGQNKSFLWKTESISMNVWIQ